MSKFLSSLIIGIIGCLLILVLFNAVKNLVTTAAVVGCEVSCSSNIDCDDENECTDDVCMYPKGCDSICYHSLRDECR